MDKKTLQDQVEAILHANNHDLESLSAKFQAERLIELLSEAGLEIVEKSAPRDQVLGAAFVRSDDTHGGR